MTGSPQDRAHVLVVDDETMVGNLLRRILEAGGFGVALASNGDEALRGARDERPDVILLDVHMPDTDGFELCRQFKSDPATADVPIVLLSGDDDESKQERGLEAGAADFLAKPFDRATVLDRVRSLVRDERE